VSESGFTQKGNLQAKNMFETDKRSHVFFFIYLMISVLDN